MPRSVNRLLTLSALMASFAATSHAAAASLADNLPAGALLTLESRGAGPAFDRLLGLVGQIGKAAGQNDLGSVTDVAGGILKGTLGQEGVAGVFSVGTPKAGFTPALLAVSRTNADARNFLADTLPRKPGAKIGGYTFVRDNDMFVGLSNGLVYVSSDKGLLMGYLSRLNGSAGARLNASPAYTTPRRAVGQQELGLYVNFSATAKVVRGQLGKLLLPRLFSPIVDALGTLGTYAAGFSTTQQGLTAQSAHLPNAAGKDGPLYSILTHTTDFAVQNIIPASAVSVSAAACAPESGGYLGRWLTRFDLFDPTGFLTDSQLAANLEKSARYLGDECAQAVLPGTDGLNGLNVSYQSVTDLNAARIHMPQFAAALNTALQGVPGSLDELYGKISALSGSGGTSGKGRVSQAQRSLQLSTQAQLDTLKRSLGKLKFVYAFRGDYVVTAYSEQALAAALADGPGLGGETLADDADFMAADLSVQGVSAWQYGRAPEELTSDAFLKALNASGQLQQAGLSEKMFAPLAESFTDLYNRYKGTSSQSTVENGLILSRSSVRYDW